MTRQKLVPAVIAIFVSSCSSGPTAPSQSSSTPILIPSASDAASSKAVTIERIRLRRTDGGDIRTDLVNGQTIDVPIGVKLDVWAEVRRLETDRARLTVDWGNGNSDFSGCGSCRLENTYVREGKYTLTVRVLDLADTTGTPVRTVVVTLNAIDLSRFAKISCSPVSNNFDALPAPCAVQPFISVPGFSVSSVAGGICVSNFPPGTANGAYASNQLTTIVFESDKNFFTATFIQAVSGALSYRAFDSSGVEVAAGVPGSVPASGVLAGTIDVSGVNFRSLELTTTAASGFNFDNLNAGCR